MKTKNCLLCQENLEKFQPPGEDKVYYLCPQCRWIALDEAFYLTPDKQKERYLQHENSPENEGYREMFEGFIRDCVVSFVPGGGTILDFGSGPEPVLAGLLRKKGYSVDTYDIFFNPDESYLSKKYDLVILTEVLEHLSNPVKVLESLVSRLNPQGAIAVMTLFHPDNQMEFSKWWYRRDPTHVTFYTLNTLTQLAEKLEMKVGFSDFKRSVVFVPKTIPTTPS